MNFKDFEYFTTLSEQGSFQKAAFECGTTQPTISNSIIRMEKELGTPLFKRTTRTLSLTPKGKEILGYAHKILNNLNTIKEIAQTHDTNIISLGLPTTISGYLYTKISNSLPNLPGHKIKVSETLKDIIKTQLDSGVINCVLLACDDDFSIYSKKFIADDPYVVAVAPDDDLVKFNSVSPCNLSERELIILSDDSKFDTSLKQLIKNNDLKIKNDTIFYSPEVLKKSLLTKGGVSILPKIVTMKEDGLIYIPFSEIEIKRSLYLIYRDDKFYKDQIEKIAKKVSIVVSEVNSLPLITAS